jgi:NodT family efflux transporter outer membrane factor (OMF) lipoprotein
VHRSSSTRILARIRIQPSATLGAGLLATLAVCISSCKVGPDFKEPETQMPEGWSSLPGADAALQSGTSVAKPTEVDVARWWGTFQDPQLTSLIERAVAGSLDLHQAASRIRQARAERTIAASGLYPGVDASASFTHAGTGSSLSGSSQSFYATSNLYRAGFDATWELDVFGGVRRGVEAADANIESALADRRSVMVTLAAEIATTYCQLRGAQQQLVITRKNLETQSRGVSLTNDRYKGGLVSALDVTTAEAQVASTKAQIPALESTARQLIYALGVLLGEQPEALVAELATEAPLPPIPPEVPVGLPSELLRRRPDVRKSEADLHAATAQTGVAVADLYPKFALNGSAGLQGSKLGALSSLNNFVWSFGPSVTLPIFHAGALQAGVDVQRELTEQALDTYKKTVLQALSDVETALVAYSKEQERRAALTEAARVQAEAVDLATQLYTVGKTDFLNVLTAQETLFSADNSLVLSNQAVVTDLIALYKALGGGWEDLSDEEPKLETKPPPDASARASSLEDESRSAAEPGH